MDRNDADRRARCEALLQEARTIRAKTAELIERTKANRTVEDVERVRRRDKHRTL